MRRGVAALAAIVALGGAGAVVASALNDLPQEAQPAPQDVTADLNRQQAAEPAEQPAPQDPAPAEALAPVAPAAPQPLVVPVEPLQADDEDEEVAEAAPTPTEAVQAPATPARRQRRRVALVEAVDKVTAERMRFEVEVGGRPVRFQRALIFSAKACEVSTPDESVEDSIAYLEVSVQPRGVLQMGQAREIFRGWMFASSPAVSGLEHPTYDAWVVGCRA